MPDELSTELFERSHGREDVMSQVKNLISSCKSANLVKFSPTVDGKVFHVELCRRLLSARMNSRKIAET